MASSINASVSGAGGLISTADNSGILNIQTAGTNAVTVDASQNVGIGTTSPSANSKLDILANASGALYGSIRIADASADATGKVGRIYGRPYTNSNADYLVIAGRATSTDNAVEIGGNTGVVNAASLIQFFTAANNNTTNGTERMRIASNGDVLIGQTTNPATSSVVIKVQTLVANGVNAQITSNTGTSYPWSNYNATGSYVGGITCTSSATAFPTSSDKRLKKNIEDAPSAIDKILTAQVVSHDWIDDNTHVDYGFVAQDLQSIIPQAVIEGTDKEDGSINMPWGVDYSKIVPLLTKAIQEQQAIINDLKARVTALENI